MHKGLKLFHAIDNQYHEKTSDLSGSIGLGAREEILEEIVSIEHEQNKLLQKKSKLILESGKLHAEKYGVTDVKLCLRKGRVLDNILDFKDELSIVVIGKYGKKHQGMSSSESPVGHKVEALVKNLHLPVLIVSEDYKAPQSIVLAYDGGEGADKVLNFLCHDLKGSRLKVDLVYFGEASDETKTMLTFAKEKLEEANFTVEVDVVSEEAEKALPAYLSKKDGDVLAMGAFGHGLLHDFFVGSLTSKMIESSKYPVLLVR